MGVRHLIAAIYLALAGGLGVVGCSEGSSVSKGGSADSVTMTREASLSQLPYPDECFLKCPWECDPVCGVDGVTYPSDCLANCAKVNVAHHGPCNHIPECDDCDTPEEFDLCKQYEAHCGCDVYTCAPVCGEDGKSYKNECHAQCVGVAVRQEGPCPEDYCTCPEICAPVCGVDGVTYLNSCFADEVKVSWVPDACPSVQEEASCEDCPCDSVCDVVCGADGITYDNSCKAACAGTSVVHEGRCLGDHTTTCEEIIADCCCNPSRCEPVCGNDGNTYDNDCRATCAGTTVKHQGACFTNPFVCDGEGGTGGIPEGGEETGGSGGDDGGTGGSGGGGGGTGGTGGEGGSGCPDICEPVCGFDGVTYINPCEAQQANADIVHDGPCITLDVCRDCHCGVKCDPVCGTDGITYDNDCQAVQCAGVQVRNPGPCPNDIYTCDSCNCEPICEPVCGVDGKTYRNSCMAMCAGVAIEHGGECPDEPPCCPCDPVCGEDWKTYKSECDAKKVSVGVLHQGACDVDIPDCHLCVCDPICDPVCGDDGKTYDNECRAGCANVGVAHSGPCAGARDTCLDFLHNCGCDSTECNAVCADDGKTYDNECIPTCKGLGLLHYGPCQWEDFLCDR